VIYVPPVNFGLIGYGMWGSCHAKAIKSVGGANLVAVCAKSEKSRRIARAEHGVRVFSDYREVIARAGIDVINIVVPNYLHAEIALAALEAQKHVLLENPMALTLKDCDNITEVAKQNDRKLYIGFQKRHSPLWGKVKEMIEDGFIGDVKYGMIELWRQPYERGSENWRYDERKVGSWLLEELIHFFDATLWYIDDVPISIYASASRAKKSSPVNAKLRDNFTAIINFPNDVHVTVSQTLAAFEQHLTVKFIGTSGALWTRWTGASDKPDYQLTYFDGKGIRRMEILKPVGEISELTAEIEDMVKVVTLGIKPTTTGQDGRKAMKLCLAAEESVRTGKVVFLS